MIQLKTAALRSHVNTNSSASASQDCGSGAEMEFTRVLTNVKHTTTQTMIHHGAGRGKDLNGDGVLISIQVVGMSPWTSQRGRSRSTQVDMSHRP